VRKLDHDVAYLLELGVLGPLLHPISELNKSILTYLHEYQKQFFVRLIEIERTIFVSLQWSLFTYLHTCQCLSRQWHNIVR
jgi:hypothetical protein